MQPSDALLDQYTPDELLDIVDSGPEPAAHDANPEPSGALWAWKQEVQAGKFGQRIDRPSTWRADALRTAACQEASGLEALRSGLTATAANWFAAADRTITQAADKKQDQRRRSA